MTRPSRPSAWPARSGGRRHLPTVYNAANEVGVDAFHDGQIGFLDIVDTVARVVDEHQGVNQRH